MSDANARPAGFVLRDRYTKVDCPEPGYEGLWIEARTNLTNGERAVLIERLGEINDRLAELLDGAVLALRTADRNIEKATDDEAFVTAAAERREANKVLRAIMAGDEPRAAALRDERLALLSPHVRAWNVCDPDYNDVPPPSIGGDASWEHTDRTILQWIANTLDQGYRLGKGIRSLSSGSGDTPAPMSGPQIVTAEAA
jgi:hypothetical protein